MFHNIIITGASNGLGMALARRYAAPGVTLGLIGRNAKRLNETVIYCKNKGAMVDSVSIDIRDRPGLINWIKNFDKMNPVDLVIANAGVMYATTKNHYVEEQDIIDEIFDVNFKGVIDTINPLIQSMRTRNNGSVAIISSLSGLKGIPTFPAYSASKAAVKIYFEAIRGLCRRNGIYVTIVCPSYVNTDMTKPLKINSFMLTDMNKAVDIIHKGIAKGKPLISFPWYHSLGIQLLKLLPERIGDRILLLILK
ncbi:MAG: SDR family NAD(P)-dependent oxidoreductase [Gammaproteobacteria bacterium]|jgi:short-subunit dehydrogenase